MIRHGRTATSGALFPPPLGKLLDDPAVLGLGAGDGVEGVGGMGSPSRSNCMEVHQGLRVDVAVAGGEGHG